MRGSASVPAGEAVAVDVVEQRQAAAVGSRRGITESWVSSVEVSHVDHSSVCGCRKGLEINYARGRVHVAKFDFGISRSNLKKLKGHISVCRATEKFVGYRGINVGNEAISCVVYVRDVARERRSGFSRQSTAGKSLLNKYDLWVMAMNVGLKCSKFGVVS